MKYKQVCPTSLIEELINNNGFLTSGCTPNNIGVLRMAQDLLNAREYIKYLQNEIEALKQNG